MSRPSILWMVSWGVNSSHSWEGKTYKLMRDALAAYGDLELPPGYHYKKLVRLEFACRHEGASKIEIIKEQGE